MSRETIENILYGDKSALNSKLYQDVINTKGVIKAGTPEAEMARKYANGLLEKINPSSESIARFEQATKGISPFFMSPSDRVKVIKAQMELYKSNILEKEAFAVQDIFQKSVLKMRPNKFTSGTQTLSVVSEK